MGSINRCLEQIEKVRQVGNKEEVAYVARSRIGRLILTTLQQICKTLDISPPSRPGPMQIPSSSDEQLKHLIEICNHLNEAAKSITQPSEPLDERWKSGWSNLHSDLNKLEECLTVIKRNRRKMS